MLHFSRSWHEGDQRKTSRGEREEVAGNKNNASDRSVIFSRTKEMMAIASLGLGMISRSMVINKAPGE